MFYKAQKRTDYWSKIRRKAPKVPDITCPAIDDILNQLEKQIDKYVEIVGPLKEFILPAGCFTGTCLHLSRVVCRRAERKIVSLSKIEWVNPKAQIYVNLSLIHI